MLAWLAHTQSTIRRSLVDAESLLELLRKKPTINDGPQQFVYRSGDIHFRNVGFSYNNKSETLKDFNLHARPG